MKTRFSPCAKHDSKATYGITQSRQARKGNEFIFLGQRLKQPFQFLDLPNQKSKYQNLSRSLRLSVSA
jgi:hypothetical protein